MTRLRRISGLVALVVVILAATATAANAHDEDTSYHCHWTDGRLVCHVGGGSGGGSGDEPPPPTYWTAWAPSWPGPCLMPDGVVGGRTYSRDHIDGATGAVLDTQITCVDIDPDPVWDEIARAASDIGVPSFDVAPPSSFGAVVNLPTLLWYEGPTQIGPLFAVVTDPLGVSYGVEGRGWIEDITWAMGDGSTVTSTQRDTFEDAAFFGDFDNPATEHTFTINSHTQGYEKDPERCNLAFTPITITLTWIGEYRVIQPGPPIPWSPVPASLAVADAFELPVVEIREVLVSEDYDPAAHECTWTEP